jgi:hypothetical protein
MPSTACFGVSKFELNSVEPARQARESGTLGSVWTLEAAAQSSHSLNQGPGLASKARGRPGVATVLYHRFISRRDSSVLPASSLQSTVYSLQSTVYSLQSTVLRTASTSFLYVTVRYCTLLQSSQLITGRVRRYCTKVPSRPLW